MKILNNIDLEKFYALKEIEQTKIDANKKEERNNSFKISDNVYLALGEPFTKEVEDLDLFILYAKDPHVDGVCILDGESLQQDFDTMFNLVKRIKAEVDKPIHMWSDYTWEEILQDDKKVNILLWIDTLVDGQREIDVQRSLLEGRMVEIC